MKRLNSTIIITAAFLVMAGVFSIYSSTSMRQSPFWQTTFQRQLLWVGIGIIFFLLMANFNYRRLWDLTYILYALAVLLLFLVFVLGIIRLGAQRWLKFAWFNLQPSEIVKLVVVIFLARYFSRKQTDDFSLNVYGLGPWRAFIFPFILVAVPVFFILEQPDLGSAIMVILIFISLLYLSGVKTRYLLFFLLLGIFIFPVFWHFLRSYQRDRLLVFLNPNIDPLGAGYTIIQAKIAIGSGGFFGRGWLSGTQSQLHFLPEAHTDFIFASFAEEWGFLGCTVLLFLYFLLIREARLIAWRTRDHFGRLLAWGIALLLALEVLVNIAMNLGLAPVVGLPLPLMSYGGSSVIVTFIALGILVNIDKKRSIF